MFRCALKGYPIDQEPSPCWPNYDGSRDLSYLSSSCDQETYCVDRLSMLDIDGKVPITNATANRSCGQYAVGRAGLGFQ